jgi:hypothetical protein
VRYIKKLILPKHYKREKDWFGYYLREYSGIICLPKEHLLTSLKKFLLGIENRLEKISLIIGINKNRLHLLTISKKVLHNDPGAFGLTLLEVKKLRVYFLYLQVNKNLQRELQTLYFFRQIVSQQICNCKKYSTGNQSDTITFINLVLEELLTKTA